MKKVVLGSVAFEVCPLIFGTLPLGPLQANLSPAEGGRLIRYALEKGMNLIDTAELYGTYPHISSAIEGYKGDVRIATKTHATTAEDARTHVEKALRELKLDRLDIVHMHGARLADPYVERRHVLEELHHLREEGKIAHIGLSTHYVSAVFKAAKHPGIDVIHPLINRTGMGIIDGSAGEMSKAIEVAAAAGKGIYAMKALAGGNLISEARSSLSYVFGLPGVNALAVGMLSLEEIDANIALIEQAPFPENRWRGLESRSRHLQIMEQFCKGCGACVASCTNEALSLRDGRAVVDEAACILCGYCAAACPDFVIRVV